MPEPRLDRLRTGAITGKEWRAGVAEVMDHDRVRPSLPVHTTACVMDSVRGPFDGIGTCAVGCAVRTGLGRAALVQGS